MTPTNPTRKSYKCPACKRQLGKMVSKLSKGDVGLECNNQKCPSTRAYIGCFGKSYGEAYKTLKKWVACEPSILKHDIIKGRV